MRNPSSTLQRALVTFWIPLLLVATFCYATSVVATTPTSANTDGKHVNDQELAKTTSLDGHNEEAKFKGFFHHKPIFKKPIPFVKPIPKPIPFVKPIPKPFPIHKPIPAVEQESFLKPVPFFKKPFFKKPIPIVKPIPKPIPVIKPIPVPVYKPIPKPVPIVKPIPIPVYKPIPKPFPIVKPIPKPFPIVKPIP